MKNLSIALEEQDLKDLKATAKKMELPPSVFARSLLLRALKKENVKLDIQQAEKVNHRGVRE